MWTGLAITRWSFYTVKSSKATKFLNIATIIFVIKSQNEQYENIIHLSVLDDRYDDRYED